MGQSNSVLVYRILASKTVDEKITKLLAEKSEIFEKFADESEIDTVNKSLINDIIEEERKAYGITSGDADDVENTDNSISADADNGGEPVTENEEEEAATEAVENLEEVKAENN